MVLLTSNEHKTCISNEYKIMDMKINSQVNKSTTIVA